MTCGNTDKLVINTGLSIRQPTTAQLHHQAAPRFLERAARHPSKPMSQWRPWRISLQANLIKVGRRVFRKFLGASLRDKRPTCIIRTPRCEYREEIRAQAFHYREKVIQEVVDFRTNIIANWLASYIPSMAGILLKYKSKKYTHDKQTTKANSQITNF